MLEVTPTTYWLEVIAVWALLDTEQALFDAATWTSVLAAAFQVLSHAPVTHGSIVPLPGVWRYHQLCTRYGPKLDDVINMAGHEVFDLSDERLLRGRRTFDDSPMAVVT